MKRHQRKFGRERNQRKALLNHLAFNLAMRGKIKTTLPRAKELKSEFDRLVAYAKKDKIIAYRLLSARLPKAARNKLVEEIAPKHKDRQGGHTRIIKLLKRKGDAAKMAFIEVI